MYKIVTWLLLDINYYDKEQLLHKWRDTGNIVGTCKGMLL